MINSKYEEVQNLIEFFKKFEVHIDIFEKEYLANNKNYKAVSIKLTNKTFKLFIDDDLLDSSYNNPILNLILVLRELEKYNEVEDFLDWCNESGFEPENTEVLSYYKDLATIYRDIESTVGKINSYVSNWDYEMGSGPMSELRIKNDL